jgi:predicted component of type VI protein secretion system
VWAYFLELRDRRIQIPEGNTVIGRSDDCGVSLDDPTASRRHAVLRRSGQRLTVTDLGSANGTFLNGERVEGTRLLSVDDRLFIGRSVLRVGAVPTEEIAGEELTPVAPSGHQPVAPGIELIERRGVSPPLQAATEPYYSSLEVLESLAASPHAAEEPAALAAMIRSSVDRLLGNMQRRAVTMPGDQVDRLLRIVQDVAKWAPDHSLDGWVGEVRRKLGR